MRKRKMNNCFGIRADILYPLWCLPRNKSPYVSYSVASVCPAPPFTIELYASRQPWMPRKAHTMPRGASISIANEKVKRLAHFSMFQLFTRYYYFTNCNQQWKSSCTTGSNENFIRVFFSFFCFCLISFLGRCVHIAIAYWPGEWVREP